MLMNGEGLTLLTSGLTPVAIRTRRSGDLVGTTQPRGPKTLLVPGDLDYRASGPINIAGSPHIRGEFLNNGIRIFQTQMHEREAFRVIFSFGGTVEALNTEQVSNLDAAVKNARAFVAGVVTMLQQSAKAEVA
jgi:hypothetical protein